MKPASKQFKAGFFMPPFIKVTRSTACFFPKAHTWCQAVTLTQLGWQQNCINWQGFTSGTLSD